MPNINIRLDKIIKHIKQTKIERVYSLTIKQEKQDMIKYPIVNDFNLYKPYSLYKKSKL